MFDSFHKLLDENGKTCESPKTFFFFFHTRSVRVRLFLAFKSQQFKEQLHVSS